jgi:hypothetical protein
MKKEDEEFCNRAIEIHRYIRRELNKNSGYPEAEITAAMELTKIVLLREIPLNSIDLGPRYMKLKR